MNLRKAIEDINNNEGTWEKYSKAEIELAIEVREKYTGLSKEQLEVELEK